ncbi:MAG: hypothetical protein COA74_04505 [Gammaproteobacteria bacterium]|nr:MAG: hypothetical protein COA74_04505 [Gammaproteobacteria bacterium]
MSGISNFAKQLISMTSISLCLLSFSALKAAEKTVKASAGIVSSSKQQSVSRPMEAESNQKMKSSSISSERKSSYKDISDPDLMIKQFTSYKDIARSSLVSKASIRNENLTSSSNSGHIYFYSVAVEMNYDEDGDGYYSDFTVSFDADTTFNYVTVYASLYASLNGGAWEHYYTTDDFELSGTSSSDVYRVRTQLTSGFPPGSYDILIDLYDAYDNSLAASISADSEYALAEHLLEDITYENSTGSTSNFSIFSASISLLDDNDNDGFYQSFSLQFDADVSFGEANVYAEIWVRDSSGNWQRDFITEDFLLDGNSTLDTYILETVWESGYSTGYYDFRVELYDADSFELVATSEDYDYALAEVPLEDAVADTQSTGGNNTGNNSAGGATSTSYGSGGSGSFGLVMLLLVAASALTRTRGKRQAEG